jgi:hypothetical protein
MMRFLVALPGPGDLLFRANHLFVAAIGGSSTRHWKQDSRPNRRAPGSEHSRR